ncbi:Alpha/Beta hydrolase protein [Chaetomium fimeti]|uniref:Alpha/Beta hydrolase protein n=1 Tax=Chaetomium fimeti TaxID=1854472 RepID=A0AAE0LQK8_9PEZI|nr:Alpha/Beta hydrolase protein [Chaetomium fimeti]
MGLLGRLPALAAAAAAFTIGTAEASYAGGGLTILAPSDVDGSQNDGSGAMLVGQPSDFETGRASCKLLTEAPWSPEQADFEATLRKALGYQEYQEIASKDQLYWISKAKSCETTCRAIDAQGKTHSVECGEELPILCTHSAPLSSSTADNNSATWQVQQTVGKKVLTGYRDYHVWKFRGVRFADTPARFTYSKAASYEDEGEVDATVAGEDCPQRVEDAEGGTSSEDCLFANVWTPYLPPTGGVDKKEKLKPVMVYIYGGSFNSGSSKNMYKDGTNLAARGDVVVIAFNYRLGSIGFLNLNDGVHNGNYGVSDQVTALEWISKYIKYFGGDPDQVTVFGESAGALSIHMLLGMEKAKGLFHGAVMESSPDGWPTTPGAARPVAWPYYDSLEKNYQLMTTPVLALTGCLNATDKVACLNQLSAVELVSLPLNPSFAVMDGNYLTNHGLVVNSTADSLATEVPVMLGVNRDETGVYVTEALLPTDNQTFLEYIDVLGVEAFHGPEGAKASAILGLTEGEPIPGLPPSLANNTATTSEKFHAAVKLTTNWLFTCNTYAKAFSAAKHAAFQSTYMFEFNRTYSPRGWTQPWCDPPLTPSHPHGDPDGEYFKCHAAEQAFVFGTVLRTGMPLRDARDLPFMQLVMDHWAAFARWGDPNPRKGWLEARGHVGTLREVERVGRWEKVDADRPVMRMLQWGAKEVPLGEGHQELCEGLGAAYGSLEP